MRRLLVTVLLSTLPAQAAAAQNDHRLADAAERRDAEAVRSLLQQRVDVNGQQPDGSTALVWAAHWDDNQVADTLIQAGANPSAATTHGVTPLYLACVNGSTAMVERLLKAGADPNRLVYTGATPLMTAARTGRVDAVAVLLSYGADVEATDATGGQTALMWAVAERHAGVTRALIKRGVNIRTRSKGGFTALLFAAQQGDQDSAAAILDAGGDPNESSPDGSSALMIAVASGREELALFLIERGASPNTKGAQYSALHAAVDKGSLELVRALLARGADPDSRLGQPPRGVIAGGAAANAVSPSSKGATPFWLAARNVDLPIMRALLANGANPLLPSADGTTPLMLAAGLSQIEGPQGRRADASRPWYYSGWNEQRGLDAVKLIVGLGADVNAGSVAAVNAEARMVGSDFPDGVGHTALHGAAYIGSNAIVRFLFEHGANLDARDKLGQTPFRIAEGHTSAGAAFYRRPETAALLRQLGADTRLGVDAHSRVREGARAGSSSGN